MHQMINRICKQCVRLELVEDSMADWFCYALEKRISTFLSVPILLLFAMYISNIWTAIACIGSFFFLRVRAGGYHAKSFLGCIFFSVLLEITFLSFVLPLLTVFFVFFFNAVSLGIIFILAPFNHPNMHMTTEEIDACRVRVRIRSCLLTALIIISYYLGSKNIGDGLTIGNTMTALLLVIAKYKK